MMEETKKTFGQWYSFDELYAMAPGEQCGEKILDALVETLRTRTDLWSKEVAIYLGVNRKDLSGSLKILMGMTLDAMVKEWRLRQAYELVMSTELGYDDIAQKCGYAQPKTLVVAFEKKYHASLYELRHGHHRNGIRLYRRQQERAQRLAEQARSHNLDPVEDFVQI